MPPRRQSAGALNRRSLHHRLECLETRVAPNVDKSPELIVEFVRPNGEFGGEVCDSDRASALFGEQVWHRQPNETQAEFKERVWSDAKARGIRVSRVIFWAVERGTPGPQAN
jgi:hypothetical protein